MGRGTSQISSFCGRLPSSEFHKSIRNGKGKIRVWLVSFTTAFIKYTRNFILKDEWSLEKKICNKIALSAKQTYVIYNSIDLSLSLSLSVHPCCRKSRLARQISGQFGVIASFGTAITGAASKLFAGFNLAPQQWQSIVRKCAVTRITGDASARGISR